MEDTTLKKKVQTVLGLIDPDMQGITFMHEHLLADLSVFFTELDEPDFSA